MAASAEDPRRRHEAVARRGTDGRSDKHGAAGLVVMVFLGVAHVIRIVAMNFGVLALGAAQVGFAGRTPNSPQTSRSAAPGVRSGTRAAGAVFSTSASNFSPQSRQ